MIPAASRGALAARFAKLFPGQPMPQSWDQTPMQVRLEWAEKDPEAVAVMEGRMDAELESRVLLGQLSAEVPELEDQKKLTEAEVAAAFAKLEEQSVAMRQAVAAQQEAHKQSASSREAALASMCRQQGLQQAAVRGG